MPEFKQKIEEAFNNASTNPEFAKESKKESEVREDETEENVENKLKKETKSEKESEFDFTVLDTFSFPKEILQNQETFLAWFEPRFFKLREEDGSYTRGLEKFSNICREAAILLDKESFILSPRIGQKFSMSSKVGKIVEHGFDTPEDMMGFFSKVAVENTGSEKSKKAFMSPDRKGKAGAERLSVCRILSTSYVLDYIRRSQDFQKFLEYSRFVLGRSPRDEKESGIFSSLIMQAGQIDTIEKPVDGAKLMSWLERSQEIKSCNLNNVGAAGSEHSYYIPEVHIGIKSGIRSFLKTIREPKGEFNILSDFLRLRFIFENNASTEHILDILHAIQEEAKKRKNPQVEVEFREKDYFSPEELEQYFPEKIDDKHVGGVLDKIKIDRNISSGEGFKNISAKIKLINPENNQKLFIFEVQFLRRKEHEKNERLETSSSHFLLEMRQLALAISRTNGKMKKEEIIRDLANYIGKHIKTEQIPALLVGNAQFPDQSGEAYMDKKFVGSLEEKAGILFDFLVSEGTLRPVDANFPTRTKPDSAQRRTSGFFIHEEIQNRVLETLEYAKEK